MVPIDKVKEIITKHDALEKELSLEILIQNYLQKNQKSIQILEILLQLQENILTLKMKKKICLICCRINPMIKK